MRDYSKQIVQRETKKKKCFKYVQFDMSMRTNIQFTSVKPKRV